MAYQLLTFTIGKGDLATVLSSDGWWPSTVELRVWRRESVQANLQQPSMLAVVQRVSKKIVEDRCMMPNELQHETGLRCATIQAIINEDLKMKNVCVLLGCHRT
jgi:hypothetical protein